MTPTLQDICEHRETLARVHEAGSDNDAVEVLRKLPRESRSLIDRLCRLTSSTRAALYDELMLNDPELAEITQSVVDKLVLLAERTEEIDPGHPLQPTSRIVGVATDPYLAINSGFPIVRLIVKTQDGRSISYSQDLEDTLQLGCAVISHVEVITRALLEELKVPSKSIIWGASFNELLERTEESTARLRAVYDEYGPLVNDSPLDSENV